MNFDAILSNIPDYPALDAKSTHNLRSFYHSFFVSQPFMFSFIELKFSIFSPTNGEIVSVEPLFKKTIHKSMRFHGFNKHAQNLTLSMSQTRIPIVNTLPEEIIANDTILIVKKKLPPFLHAK